ncbi:MAG: S8 family serine peptidase, partial [Planctomycetia bacterium]|nr:S8 family serine peptidase [Planctomycetia bacterium]
NTADQGYLSNFRPVTATVGTLGLGTYMNFDPSGGTTTQLPITVGSTASAATPARLIFQFDQPYATQQPSGSTAAPTSEVDFYVLDSTGAVVASGTNDNVKTRAPFQEADVTAPGSYTVVMKVASGKAPNHVEFVNFDENIDVTVSKKFGTGPAAGGTYYTTAFGHAAAASVISVGAVPWWATSPFLNQTPLASEPFSTFGPNLITLQSNGTPLAAPNLIQAPTVSGPDGGNTTFFGPNEIIDTSKPPTPGEPATATNLSQNLPSFFGSSAAAPNVTAVAALMLQKTPTLSTTQIHDGLIASAQPLDGSAQGAWNPQGGFGLVNAVRALTAVGSLTVITTTPNSATTVTPAPSAIDVTFDRPVKFGTVTAADLVFTSLPPGVA